MSATPGHAERLAILDLRIERLQQLIVKQQLQLGDTVDLEQTLWLLMEARRVYVARAAQIEVVEVAGGARVHRAG